MNTILFLYVMMGLFWAVFGGYWAFNKVMTRFSPKYALKRKAKEEKRNDRSREKRRKRAAAREARLRKWAKENPDDPFAKTLLAPTPSVEQPVSKDTGEPDYLSLLRKRQEDDDIYKRREEERRLAKEMEAQRLLEWSIENPAIPEARRHLNEQLDDMTKRLEHADYQVRHFKTMMSYKEEGESEFVLLSMQLAEAETKLAVEIDLVRRIQTALEAPLPESSEQ